MYIYSICLKSRYKVSDLNLLVYEHFNRAIANFKTIKNKYNHISPGN